MTVKESRDVTETKGLSKYYNASQFRSDTWSKVKYYANQLSEPGHSAEDVVDYKASLKEAIENLEPVQMYWSFPGKDAFAQLMRLYGWEEYRALGHLADSINKALTNKTYRHKDITFQTQDDLKEDALVSSGPIEMQIEEDERPYFEVMVVDQINSDEERKLRRELRKVRSDTDTCIYSTLFIHSFEDALIAILLNTDIQTAVIRYGFPFRSKNSLPPVQRTLHDHFGGNIGRVEPEDRGPMLARMIGELRPEIDVFLVTDVSVEKMASRTPSNCRRVFYQQEDMLELHLNILRGINDRYDAPFFEALKQYSKRPTGVFHALPISRGKSIINSNWIKDMGKFYGMAIFMAETSATSGGLDSLLEPRGPIKKAHEKAARAYGSQYSFFCTNGTSTSNKIIVQAVVKPSDIVLVDRDCHKSHHYGMVLGGADVVYLDSYSLDQYSMYGAVPLKEIKRALLKLRAAGKLDRVKMLLLTNCTFDGIVYNVKRVMEECLAIKPDLVFLWDEAWFAFAGFAPTYRQRTGMHSAKKLIARYKSAEYRKQYEEFSQNVDVNDDKACLENRLMPDPDKARVRCYVTHSTHKTLTSLRQGSMMHIYDQDFHAKVEDSFHEAFMTHTSTSPNYQIIASLDVGRRQVELEGFELVSKQVELAMLLREQIASLPEIRECFHFLKVKDMIPPEYRESGIESYYDPVDGWSAFFDAWVDDEFVLDPTRLTLYTGSIGINGDTFKNKVLMDRFGIQINKTSRNSVLFLTNIGTTRSSIAYLIEALMKITNEFKDKRERLSPPELKALNHEIYSLTEDLPPLPHFSRFHRAFMRDPDGSTPEGRIRDAFFAAYDEANCDYMELAGSKIDKLIESGIDVVSASFVIPYPPGFPILVPGQVISREILDFMRALDVTEIHGYRPDLGLKVFTEARLQKVNPDWIVKKQAPET
jgi:arginine decarboxylase